MTPKELEARKKKKPYRQDDLRRRKYKEEETQAMDKPKPLEVVSDGDLSEVKKDPEETKKAWEVWLEKKDMHISDLEEGGDGIYRPDVELEAGKKKKRKKQGERVAQENRNRRAYMKYGEGRWEIPDENPKTSDKAYITKPIPDSKGGKGSFQHCINTNQDKHNPGGWCKQIERKIGKGIDPGDDSPRRGRPHDGFGDDPTHGDEHRRSRRPSKDPREESHGKQPPRGHGRRQEEEDDVIPKDSFQNTRGMKLEEKPDPEDETDRLRNEPVYGNVALPRVERKPTKDFESRISQLGSRIQDKKIRDAITNQKMPDTKELRSDADRATISRENALLYRGKYSHEGEDEEVKISTYDKLKRIKDRLQAHNKARQTKIDKPKDWWDHSKVGRQGDIDQKTGRPWWEVVTEEEERKKKEKKKIAEKPESDYYMDAGGNPQRKEKAEKVTPETHYTTCPTCGSDDTKYGGKHELQRANDWETKEWWECPHCSNTFEPRSKKSSADAKRRYEESKKTDYFVEEIRANIIYHNKIFPLVGMIAGAAGKVGAKGAKIGGEILDDMKDLGSGALQGVGEEAEEEQ